MNRTILRLATLGAVAALGLTACSSGEDADSASGDAVQCVGSGDPNTLTVYSGRTEKLVKPLFDRVDESVLGPGVKLEALQQVLVSEPRR